MLSFKTPQAEEITLIVTKATNLKKALVLSRARIEIDLLVHF